MLTSTQLRELTKQTGITSYYQEKDYLQNIFLFNLYKEKKGENFIFKGGTCLKLAYNYSRFSEDLDFNSKKIKSKEVGGIIKNVLKSFKLLGINFEFIKEEFFEDAYTTRIRFYGPLYGKRIESTNAIQLDIGKRGGVILKPKWAQINSPYPDIPKFFVLVMDEKEILTEKIRALTMRSKPRDLFDVWSMINAKVKIEKKLLDKKLREKKLERKNILFCSKKEYERDLSNLLPVLPPYEQVVRKIKEKLDLK